MLRGRIVAARGVKAEDLKPSHDAEWVLQSDRGLTYTGEIPKGSKVVEGKWWGPDYDGPPLVSFEKKLADGLGLKIGDEVVVNVLGRDIAATIGNMRTVDWQSLGINFVLVFSPDAFKGAPHTHVATLTEAHPDAAGDAKIIRAVADAFPMVTSVRVREALETIGTRGHQSGAGDPRRQRGDADLRHPGAGRGAGRRPPPPGLRRGDPEDPGRHPGPAARRLCAGISDDRLCHRDLRRSRGLGRGMADRDPADDAGLCLAGRQRRRRGAAALIVTVGLGLAGTLVALNQKPATVLRNL